MVVVVVVVVDPDEVTASVGTGSHLTHVLLLYKPVSTSKIAQVLSGM